MNSKAEIIGRVLSIENIENNPTKILRIGNREHITIGGKEREFKTIYEVLVPKENAFLLKFVLKGDYVVVGNVSMFIDDRPGATSQGIRLWLPSDIQDGEIGPNNGYISVLQGKEAKDPTAADAILGVKKEGGQNGA